MSQPLPPGVLLLPIDSHDLAALRSVILGYLAASRRRMPRSPEQQRQFGLLQGVYQRLTQSPRNATRLLLPLTKPEIEALNSAIVGFAAFVRQKVAASRERDEALRTLEGLRSAVVEMLVPSARLAPP